MHNRSAVQRITCAALMLVSLAVPAAAADEDELRAAFERFVAAQNAHDVEAVDALLLGPPSSFGSRAVRRSGGRMRRWNASHPSTREHGALSLRLLL